MNIWAVILAAGQSTRLARQGLRQKKQFLEFQGVPLFWHSVLTFAGSSVISGAIITFPPDDISECIDISENLERKTQPGIPVICASGGTLRQDSVYNGLMALPDQCDHVMIHDAARPFFTARLVHELINGLEADCQGVIPVILCKDTVKLVENQEVVATLDRNQAVLVQTPQFFPRNILAASHEKARQEGIVVTDDASMAEHSGFRIRTISGSEDNIKITTLDDLKMLENNSDSSYACSGLGYDVHRYGGPRPMVVGGIPIPGGPGIFAHSDGDVLIHALVDAILGCLGKGDIGDHFPDTDSRHEGLSSSVFLSEVLLMAQQENLNIKHIDITLVAQVPRLSPFKAQIRSNLAGLTGLHPDRINIKATTEEKLGFTGTKQGIKAMAMVSAVKHNL